MIGAIILGNAAGYVGRLLMPGRDNLGFIAATLPPLAGRIAISVIAAVCAVLIPGEAGRLMTTPLWATRRARGRAASAARATRWRAGSAA